jgi:NitT/TauT family transport system ATP-binding protein
MDEPFGALDPTTREDMQVYLLEIWQRLKTTVFFVTHDLEEALYLGSRVLVLSQYYDDGRQYPCRRGAKIVADYLGHSMVSGTQVKSTPEFRELLENIRVEGFDPRYLNHVGDFNLKHPDSWRTLTREEQQ